MGKVIIVVGVSIAGLMSASLGVFAQTAPDGSFLQNNYGAQQVQVVQPDQPVDPNAQVVRQLPQVVTVPAPAISQYPYPYPYPYPTAAAASGVQPFPGYCPYQGYPTCVQQSENTTVNRIANGQPGQAGSVSLKVPNRTTPSSSGPVDPAVYQRGQSPYPGDNGAISKLNEGVKKDGIRGKLLKRRARSIGISDGYLDETQRLNSATTAMARKLDAKYNFAPLMIEGFIVPPVITNAKDVIEKGGRKVLYLSFGAFVVRKEAHLATQYPNWREYLLLQAKGSRDADKFPLNDKNEIKVWRQSYRDGYLTGKREAREAFRVALNRLDRDFQGMKNYHKLAAKGAVSVPTAQYSDRDVRIMRKGKRDAIDESVVRLKVNTRFISTRREAYQISNGTKPASVVEYDDNSSGKAAVPVKRPGVVNYNQQGVMGTGTPVTSFVQEYDNGNSGKASWTIADFFRDQSRQLNEIRHGSNNRMESR